VGPHLSSDQNEPRRAFWNAASTGFNAEVFSSNVGKGVLANVRYAFRFKSGVEFLVIKEAPNGP
jgi:hypothetical protein